jgi:hypothetical protein
MSEYTDVNSTNVNMRARASTSGCSVLTQANPGQQMMAHCSVVVHFLTPLGSALLDGPGHSTSA